MLIQFTMENFLSFKEETTLSLEAGLRMRKFNDTNTFKAKNHRLLKNVNLFGPNGSGKTNILQGLRLFKKLILRKTPDINTSLPYLPFALNTTKLEEPTYFEIEFYFDEYQYRYAIAYNEESYSYEHLEYLSGGEYKTYFIQENGEFIHYPKKYSKILNEIRRNTLMLYKFQDLNDKHSSNVLKWFNENLVFCDDLSLSDSLDILEDKQVKNLFLNLIKTADFNIKDVILRKKVTEIQGEEARLLSSIRNLIGDTNLPLPSENTVRRVISEIDLMYDKYDTEGNFVELAPISLNLDSAGTKKFIRLILAILDANQNGNNKILVLDEFDDSFHLALSQELIHLFNSKYNENQFVLTSHELQHMDCDIRKDQIFLIEKDYDGESHLFSLFDFNNVNAAGNSNYKNSRQDMSFFKQYLRGSFGGNPKLVKRGLIEVMADFYEEKSLHQS